MTIGEGRQAALRDRSPKSVSQGRYQRRRAALGGESHAALLPAGLRHAPAMPEHQELEAPITGCVATALRGFLYIASRSAMYTLSRIVL
jgi:hypothetical protein